MSNYGHNYGSLEEYAKEKALQSDLEFCKKKEVFAIVRVEDGFFLEKNDSNLYYPYVSEDIFLTKHIGRAFEKLKEEERKQKGHILRPERVYIDKELFDMID